MSWLVVNGNRKYSVYKWGVNNARRNDYSDGTEYSFYGSGMSVTVHVTKEDADKIDDWLIDEDHFTGLTVDYLKL